MSIMTTIEISREDAIARINQIQDLVLMEDYLGVEQTSFETSEDIEQFVLTHKRLDVARYTNKMLEKIMDKPFFRQNMFSNYNVV